MATSYQPRPAALKGMQGPGRVPALLLTMGKSLSGRLMKHFDADEIKQIKNGFGLMVMSTPKGIMTGDDAKKGQVGGEALFKIW